VGRDTGAQTERGTGGREGGWRNANVICVSGFPPKFYNTRMCTGGQRDRRAERETGGGEGGVLI